MGLKMRLTKRGRNRQKKIKIRMHLCHIFIHMLSVILLQQDVLRQELTQKQFKDFSDTIRLQFGQTP